MAMNRVTSIQESRKLHRQNMRSTLLNRIEIARINGNQALVTMLENEQKELGLW
jgi:hypothetical protein